MQVIYNILSAAALAVLLMAGLYQIFTLCRKYLGIRQPYGLEEFLNNIQGTSKEKFRTFHAVFRRDSSSGPGHPWRLYIEDGNGSFVSDYCILNSDNLYQTLDTLEQYGLPVSIENGAGNT